MTPKDMSLILLVYAFLLVMGGWIGFLKAKSKPSLIAGHISGLLVIVAILLMAKGNAAAGRGGCLLATITALALTLFFGKRFAKTRKPMPAGIMAVVSAVVFLILIMASPSFAP
ncbi:MAG: TMEM14 family protein [Isosphaeraceae bacterium]